MMTCPVIPKTAWSFGLCLFNRSSLDISYLKEYRKKSQNVKYNDVLSVVDAMFAVASCSQPTFHSHSMVKHQ